MGAPLLLGLLFLTAVRRPAAVIHPAVEPVLVLVPLIWMALRFSTRDVQIGVAVAAVAVAGVSAHGSGAFWAFAGSRSWREAVLSLDLFLFVSCGGTILINLLAVQQRALVHRLERDQEQLRRYARALDEAEDRARRAAAADLHDGIGQLLAGLGMTLRVLRSRTPAGEVQALVDDAADTCGHAQRSIRHVIQDLSPPEVDSASPSQMLAWLSQTFRDRYGFEVTWHVSGERLPSAHHTRLLYRCTRELLLNAWKHSGHGRAEVGLELTDHHIELTVIDEGVGFDTAQPAAGLHFGLAQLRERLHASGGALTVDSVVGEGCCATISIPPDSAAGLAVVQT